MCMFPDCPPRLIQRAQRGVVLIIALIMLAVISLLASLSMRNAISTESVSGSVRTTQLATQAAEIALRYCEESVVRIVSGTGTFVTTFASNNILTYSATPTWSLTSNWDVNPSSAFVLPATALNQTGLGTTYNRPPECMVENIPMADASGAVSTTTTYVITARGFGPEVAAADSARSRPKGSEVWLQSTIELQ